MEYIIDDYWLRTALQTDNLKKPKDLRKKSMISITKLVSAYKAV